MDDRCVLVGLHEKAVGKTVICKVPSRQPFAVHLLTSSTIAFLYCNSSGRECRRATSSILLCIPHMVFDKKNQGRVTEVLA